MANTLGTSLLSIQVSCVGKRGGFKPVGRSQEPPEQLQETEVIGIESQPKHSGISDTPLKKRGVIKPPEDNQEPPTQPQKIGTVGIDHPGQKAEEELPIYEGSRDSMEKFDFNTRVKLTKDLTA